MIEYFNFVTENTLFPHLMYYARNYLSTMTELFMNTYDELKLSTTPFQSATFGLKSQDVTVLLTACFSLFGLTVAFFTIFSLLKCLHWICLGSDSSRREVGGCDAQFSPLKLENSSRWHRQAWFDLMAARNDFEGYTPAPEWVCFKCQQAFEKGLKALLFATMKEFTFTSHDICELAAMTGDAGLQDMACQVQGIVGVSSRMRYPDMLPLPKIPRDIYSVDNALQAYQLTHSSLSLIRHRMRKLTGVDS